MPKVVFAQKTDEAVLGLVRPFAEVVCAKENDPEALRAELAGADALVVGTWVKFGPEWMDAAPRLKVISRTGAGVDSVDVAAATARGILVLNTPTANSLSVAEHATTMIAALAKGLVFLHKSVVAGNFAARRLGLPVDLDGKTLGLVGCGNIGRQVAAKCRAAFGMRVMGHDPFLKQAPEGIELAANLDEMFAQADVVSLHIPLTPETKHSVGARLIGLMKPGAYLVNTARGGVIDEEALYAALSEKRIAGAALDVFEQEPPPVGCKLAGLDNILLTPHSAALTRECTLRVAACAAQGVADWLQGKTPQFTFNRAALQHNDK